jgi:hypothetical protein
MIICPTCKDKFPSYPDFTAHIGNPTCANEIVASPFLNDCRGAMEETKHLDPPALEHPRLMSLAEVQEEYAGSEKKCICNEQQPCASHAAVERLSHACQYTNHNHCSGCPCDCHKRAPIHLDNPAPSFAPGDWMFKECRAFNTAGGPACPLPMGHEEDCPV